jgi:asparagine synthase (glutamine-hydrolysing)
MCGIAGILTHFNFKPIENSDLDKLIAPIHHRGPNGSGIWIHENKHIGFAHRRLSIIDLSENGKQPFHRKDLGLSITFNGEIYNYIELKETLSKLGHHFNTTTDTEVILAAYKEYGYECIGKFDGMFAFAIWDEQKKEMFCARDRFGEKPFHYYFDSNQFVFGSEIKQFWSYGILKKISLQKLSKFIDHSEIIDDTAQENTFFETIYSLKAAHYLICKPDLTFTIKNYWNLNQVKVDTTISFNDAIIKFNSLFDLSINNRLRADVPLGSSLSGGLDSSCIVYTVNKKFLKPVQDQFTFSARFKNYEKDEGEFIEALINDLPNVKRADVFLDVDEFENDIQRIIYHQDEPFQSASIFAQYKVMQLARKNNVTVLLDGQGADELLGGYENLYIDYLKQLFYNDPKLYQTEAYAYNNLHGNKYGKIDFYKKDTLKLKINRKIKSVLNKEQAVPSNYFYNVLKNYITGSQLQQLLRYADRNSMAHSVETRLPFLNHELVEFVFSLPDDFKLKNGWPKYILRKVFEKKVPDKIIWRKNKIGFETPETNFLNTERSQLMIKKAQQYILDNKIGNANGVTNPWLLYMLDSYTSN